MEIGPASFPFEHVRDGRPVPMTVWTYTPSGFSPDSPILFVLHGARRNAETYRDAWIEHAERHGALLLAPEFSERSFPGPRLYEVGNMRTRDRVPLPASEWSYAAIDGIFDAVRRLTGTRRTAYSIFGHSAGAQFVHRLLTFTDAARVDRAVAANAGCYTLPLDDERFPYGLGGMPSGIANLAGLFGRKLVLVLGEDDVDEDDPVLLKSPEAMRQGPHRLARGHRYFAAGAEAARRIGAAFAWRLVTVPGVGHSNKGLARHAARLLLT